MKYELAKYEIKKHQIINAAFKRIYEQGIEGTTMRSIAKEAKVNQALLHYYFKNKEHLLEEFLQTLFNRFIYDIEKRYKASDPHPNKLEGYFAAGKDFVEKQRELFVVMIDVWTYCFRNKKLHKDYAELNRRLTGVMRNILAAGKQDGVFNDVNEDTLAILYVSFVVGIGCLWHMDNRSFNLSDEFDIMTRNLRQLLLKNDVGNKPLL
jgi:AcrR family transcriptional regulator